MFLFIPLHCFIFIIFHYQIYSMRKKFFLWEKLFLPENFGMVFVILVRGLFFKSYSIRNKKLHQMLQLCSSSWPFPKKFLPKFCMDPQMPPGYLKPAYSFHFLLLIVKHISWPSPMWCVEFPNGLSLSNWRI